MLQSSCAVAEDPYGRRNETYRHLSKLLVPPPAHRRVHNGTQSFPLDADTVSIRIELEQHVLAPKDEEVGVLGDDAVDDAVEFQVRELSIGFVGCNDVRDVLRFERLGCMMRRASEDILVLDLDLFSGASP